MLLEANQVLGNAWTRLDTLGHAWTRLDTLAQFENWSEYPYEYLGDTIVGDIIAGDTITGGIREGYMRGE